MESMSSDVVGWLTATGTAGAAVFAGWAALSASAVVRENRRLVDIELQRDRERAEAERTAQARRVSVTLITESLHDESGQHGVDFHLVVSNASDSPVFKVRLKVVAGAGQWGPQLVGNLVPGQQLDLYARIYTSATLSNTDAAVRFVDANSCAWVATARTSAEPTSEDPGQWIVEGEAFARRDLDLYERGSLSGLPAPDFDGWRSEVEGLTSIESVE